MAGDWIKIENVTQDKPEIGLISDDLGIDHDAVLGKLIRLWTWADQQSLSGHAISVTEKFIDRITCHAGFAQALRNAHWLSGENGAITFPNFDRHNGETAKERALASKRQKRKRSRKERDKSVTREEKRREEIDTSKDVSSAARKFIKPTLSEVTDYCQSRANKVDPQRFISHYESNGWRVGKNPMKDWKAAIHTWEKSEFSNGNNFAGSSAGRSQGNRPGRHQDPTQDDRIDEIMRSADQGGTGAV